MFHLDEHFDRKKLGLNDAYVTQIILNIWASSHSSQKLINNVLLINSKYKQTLE